MKMNKIILIGLTLLTTNAFAKHGRPPSCIQERWIPIKEEVKSSTCTEVEKLKLLSMYRTYPHIGEMNVRYWQGRLEKSVETIKTYTHNYINVCTGQVTFSEEVPYSSVKSQSFEIVNPNLDLEIRESYKLAPLTNDEAKAAFETLKAKCSSI